jgi:RNase P subunit RPR2
MRSFILLALVVIVAPPARAAKRVTVQQLEQALTAATGGHKSDKDTVHLINSMELSERLTEVTRVRISQETVFKQCKGCTAQLPYRHCRQVLRHKRGQGLW